MLLSGRYAQFTSRLVWRDLPEDIHRIAFELFVDWFANAAAGFGAPLTQALLAVSPEAGKGVRVGDLKPTDPLAATMINAAAAHALEFDDAFRAGLYHPGAPIIAAALSAACMAGASGAGLLSGIVAAYEVSLRLAAAINPAHYAIWHTTGTVGAFGAAAAAARIFGLPAERTGSALGLAGTQAAGLWEVLPDAPLAKNLHPAKAAHAGLLAAVLAARGIDGPATIFEGKQGFFAATVPAPVDFERCVAGLGTQWLTAETTFKAYPVCGHTMMAIEAALQLAGTVAVGDIAAIEVRAHPVSVQVAGEPNPASEAQAKFSIAYCVAVALDRRRVGMAEFAPETLQDPAIRDLLARTTLIADDTLGSAPGRRPARVTLRLQNGEMRTAQAEIRKGDPELPMSAAEKREKCISLAASAWGRARAERVVGGLAALPDSTNVPSWIEELRGFLAA